MKKEEFERRAAAMRSPNQRAAVLAVPGLYLLAHTARPEGTDHLAETSPGSQGITDRSRLPGSNPANQWGLKLSDG